MLGLHSQLGQAPRFPGSQHLIPGYEKSHWASLESLCVHSRTRVGPGPLSWACLYRVLHAGIGKGGCVHFCCGVYPCPSSCLPGQSPYLLGLVKKQNGGPKVAPSFWNSIELISQGL
jgi:hypothetical protein